MNTGLPGTPTVAISVSIPTFRLDEGIERQAVALLLDVDEGLLRGLLS